MSSPERRRYLPLGWRLAAVVASVLLVGLTPALHAVPILDLGPAKAIAGTPPNSTYGVPKPSSLRARLPWAAGVSHHIGWSYGQCNQADRSQGDHCDGDAQHSQDYYALDFDLALDEYVYPVAAGTLLYAGPSGSGYGTIVLIKHMVGADQYESLYAHLDSVDPSLLSGGTYIDGKAIDPNSPIGRAGSSGTSTVHLHFALYKGAQRSLGSYNGPYGGQAVVPEPLIGLGVYENFAWFKGPLIAMDIDPSIASDSSPGGTWIRGTNGATNNGSLLGPGTKVVYKAHVTSSHPIKEVHFTAGYDDWAKTAGTAFASPAFPSTLPNLGIWRIVGICSPGQPCWNGSSTAADVTFAWNPWNDSGGSPVGWLPKANSAAPTGPTNRRICISFDVYDSSGAGNLAPNGTRCDTGTLLPQVQASSTAGAQPAGAAPADTTDNGAELVTLYGGPANGWLPATAVAAGKDSTCALLADGTVRCWGYNGYGQLGDGTTTAHSVPVGVSGITTATAIATGGDHACALLAGGTVECWGAGGYGELGNGNYARQTVPVGVWYIHNATAITAGEDLSCALLAEGTVACWGWDWNGELGDGMTQRVSSVPVMVNDLTGATAIASGGDQTCALMSDGGVKCWGANFYGQLGNGTTAISSLTPVPVSGVTTATAIAAGELDTCALMADGTVRCWGANDVGEIGDGTTGSIRTTPVTVSGISTATAIDTGDDHSCALLSDGSVQCWGNNATGELGDGTTQPVSSVPVMVSGIGTATAVSAGSYHTCSVLTDGSVRCWGSNFYSELGDGTTTDSRTAVTVKGLPATAATHFLVTTVNLDVAGAAQSVVVTALDASGNSNPYYHGRIHFTSTDPAAVLPPDYTFTGDCTFTGHDAGVHIFVGLTFKTAGTRSVTAADTATASIKGTQSGIVVTPAAAKTLTVKTANPYVAGVGHSVTVTAKDAYGNVATGYRGTVHFTSSDPAAVLPANHTFIAGDAGVHVLTLTLKTAGSRSVTATDTVSATITGAQTVVVTPAAAKTLVVSTANPYVAGVGHTVTVTARDVYGNLATGYRGRIHFTSSDPAAVLPANYTFVAGDNGVHILTLTFKTAGSRSVTATDTVTASITGAQTVVVTSAAAKTLVVSTANPYVAGVGHSVTVTARDAYGNVATGYTGTIHLTSSDPHAVLPANYTFIASNKGVHILTLVLKTAGSRWVRATDTVNATITGVQTVVLTPGAAKTLVVSGIPSPYVHGVAHSFTVTAKDAYGNVATGYTGTIHFTTSDTKASVPADYKFTAVDKGVHTFSSALSPALVLRTAGSQWVRATDKTTATITGVQSVSVT